MASKGPQDYWNKYLVAKVNDRDIIVKNPDPNTQHPSGYNQYDLLQKIRYHITTHTHFNYDLHVSQSSEYGRYDKMSPMNAFSKYATWNYGPQSWIMNHLSLNHSKKRQLFDHFKLHFAHQFVRESRITRRLYDQNLKNQTENVNAYSFNIDFKKNGANMFFIMDRKLCATTLIRGEIQSTFRIKTPFLVLLGIQLQIGIFLRFMVNTI